MGPKYLTYQCMRQEKVADINFPHVLESVEEMTTWYGS